MTIGTIARRAAAPRRTPEHRALLDRARDHSGNGSVKLGNEDVGQELACSNDEHQNQTGRNARSGQRQNDAQKRLQSGGAVN